jgi:polyisoprenoid-binding protein YceI
MLPLALLAAAAAAPTTYSFDPAASKLYVQVYRDRDTLATSMAHDHVVTATGWSGSLTLDPNSIATCVVSVRVPVSGLKPDLPEMRGLVSYDVMLTDAQQKQVDEHMKGEEQLNVGVFPEMRFEATTCSGTATALSASGKLSMVGHVGAVTIPVKIESVDGGLRLRGSFKTTHAAMGLVPYSAMFGTLKNQEGLDFTLDVVARTR